MHVGMLAHFQLSQMEAECLRIPDHVLKLPERCPPGASGGQRILHQPQVGDEVLDVVVGMLGASGPSCLEPLADHQHLLPVRFARGPGPDLGKRLGHRHRVAFQSLGQGTRGRRGDLVGGQCAPDPFHRDLQGFAGVFGLDGQRPSGDFGGHVRIAVPVAADPGTEPDERGHRAGDRAAGRADQRSLGGPVQPGHSPDQGLVEDRHDGAHLVQRFRLGGAQDRRQMQQFDLFQQAAAGDVLGLGAQPGILQSLQLLADPAQGGGDRAAPGLRRVRGEHGMNAQIRQHLLHAFRGRDRWPQIVPGVSVRVR